MQNNSVPYYGLGGFKRANLNFIGAASALAMLLSYNSEPYPYIRERKKAPQICNLPDCGCEIDHNGGYCSAEHCKLHKKKMKESQD